MSEEDPAVIDVPLGELTHPLGRILCIHQLPWGKSAGGGREEEGVGGREEEKEGRGRRRRGGGGVTIGCGPGFKLDVLRLSVNVHVHK